MDFLKDIISTRGAQLVARYAGVGLTALGTYLGATIPAANLSSVAETVGALVVAAVLFAIDHWSHKEQKA